jgi:hypothetical protein
MAVPLLGVIDAAERDARHPPRVGRAMTAALVLLGLSIQVESGCRRRESARYQRGGTARVAGSEDLKAWFVAC